MSAAAGGRLNGIRMILSSKLRNASARGLSLRHDQKREIRFAAAATANKASHMFQVNSNPMR